MTLDTAARCGSHGADNFLPTMLAGITAMGITNQYLSSHAVVNSYPNSEKEVKEEGGSLKEQGGVKDDSQEYERESITTLTGSEEGGHPAGPSQSPSQLPAHKLPSNQDYPIRPEGRQIVHRADRLEDGEQTGRSESHNDASRTTKSPSSSSSPSTATVVEDRPVRVRFRSRVRITSGIHRHGRKHRHSDPIASSTGDDDVYPGRGRKGSSDVAPRPIPRRSQSPDLHSRSPISSRSTSPSSSISVPLRTDPDEGRDANSIWGPLGQRVGRFALAHNQELLRQAQLQQQQQRGREIGLGSPRGRFGFGRGPEMIAPSRRPMKKRGKGLGVYINGSGRNLGIGGGGGGYRPQMLHRGDYGLGGEREALLRRPYLPRSYLDHGGIGDLRNESTHAKLTTPAGAGITSINQYIIDDDLASEGLFVHEGDADDEGGMGGRGYDDYTYELDDEESRLSREIDVVFGKWPGRLLNRHVRCSSTLVVISLGAYAHFLVCLALHRKSDPDPGLLSHFSRHHETNKRLSRWITVDQWWWWNLEPILCCGCLEESDTD